MKKYLGHDRIWLQSYNGFAGARQCRIEVNERTVAIIINALAHSIQKQKFQLIHAEKRIRIKDYADLNYPQFLSILCEKSKEFRCTVDLYKCFLEEFRGADVANVYNENYLWIRKSRKN